MKKIFIVYETDAWLMHNSKKLLGIFTTQNKAIKGIKIFLSLNHTYAILSLGDLYNLNSIHQTQGRNFNYLIEEIELNKCIL